MGREGVVVVSRSAGYNRGYPGVYKREIEMRKVVGVLVAAALMLPIAGMIGTEAGAAAATLPTCKALTGTQTFTPGLPKLGDPTLVKPVTKTDLKITGCTGGGITSGTSDSSTKATTATNCNTLVKNSGKPGAPSTGTIKWSNGSTSTTSNVLTVTSKPGASPIIAKLVSKYTAGLGKGHTSTAIIQATPNAGFCLKVPFTKSTFKSTKITTT